MTPKHTVKTIRVELLVLFTMDKCNWRKRCHLEIYPFNNLTSNRKSCNNKNSDPYEFPPVESFSSKTFSSSRSFQMVTSWPKCFCHLGMPIGWFDNSNQLAHAFIISAIVFEKYADMKENPREKTVFIVLPPSGFRRIVNKRTYGTGRRSWMRANGHPCVDANFSFCFREC